MHEREQEVQALQAMTHRQLCDWYRHHLVATSPHRRRLAVHVVGRAHAAEVQSGVSGGVELVEDLEVFKTAAKWYTSKDGQLPEIEGGLHS